MHNLNPSRELLQAWFLASLPGYRCAPSVGAIPYRCILSWSRSHGVFAGLSLEGATLRADQDENAKLFGKPLTNEAILTGTVKRPAGAATFLAQLERFSGKGVPPAVIPVKSHQPTAPPSETSASKSSNTASEAADNTVNNKPDVANPEPTADQQGMARLTFN